jgi:nickel/cobalt transporter (NicO) family protein
VELTILLWTAVSIGFIHTAIGPDHYLPFVMMARAGKWTLRKTGVVVLLCGIGHVASSVVLGLIGITCGMAISKLLAVESMRGELAAWLLIGFGLVYFVWGLRKAFRSRPHEHAHAHDGMVHHSHVHSHTSAHVHSHSPSAGSPLTPWVLFTIFIFGPCEPLIPLLMYPAAKQNAASLALVATVFGTTTIGTMIGITLASVAGITRMNVNWAERYSQALAGFAILMCGGAIKWLGL